MKEITRAMYSWGEWKAQELLHNPFSDTNILHRYQTEGEVQSMPARDRILCYDPPEYKAPKQRVIDINQQWQKLSNRPKQCVFAKYVLTLLLKDDGNPLTAREASRAIGVNHDTFNRNVSRGVMAINSVLRL